MSQPNPYNRQYNFSNFQAENPNDPLPANQVDAELNAIKVVIDQIRVSVAAMQRDDYAIKNSTIGYDQLKPELDGFGFNPPTSWVSSHNYIVRDTVFATAAFYQCLVSHISSGNFDDDLEAGYWELVADFTAIVNQTDASNLTSGTLPDARLSFTVSTFIRDLLDDTSASAARATISAVSAADVAAAIADEIGDSVQAYSARLVDIAALAVTDGNFIVGNGTTFVVESGATARTSIGLGTGDSPQFSSINVGNASDTTLSRAAAGVIAVEGLPLYPGIPVTDKSAAYTTVLADAQTCIRHPASDNNARTFTIAANASVAYPVGSVISFLNEINTVTIAINSDTLVLAGEGTTGSVTLAANGIATALKVASTRWYISGVGLTAV